MINGGEGAALAREPENLSGVQRATTPPAYAGEGPRPWFRAHQAIRGWKSSFQTCNGGLIKQAQDMDKTGWMDSGCRFLAEGALAVRANFSNLAGIPW